MSTDTDLQHESGGDGSRPAVVPGPALRAEAHDALARGDYEAAAGLFEQVVNADPNDGGAASAAASAYRELGHQLYNQGRHEEATAKYARSAELDDAPADTWIWWGNALRQLRRYREAVLKYKRAAAIEPNSALTHAWWGNALDGLGKEKQALAKYRRAVELSPDSGEVYLQWGNGYHLRSEYAEAGAKYAHAAGLSPESAVAYRNWGSALYNQRRFGEAAEKHERAHEIEGSVASLLRWGDALLAAGDARRALEVYEKATQMEPKTANGYSGMGYAFSALGRRERALTRHRKAVELGPEDAGVHLGFADALREAGRTEEAASEYARATELATSDEERATALFNWGFLLNRDGDHDEALAKYRAAAEAKTDFVYACHNIAHVLDFQGKYAAAGDQCLRVLDLYERQAPRAERRWDPDFHAYLAMLLLETFADLDGAERELERALAIDPDHAFGLLLLVRVYLARAEEDPEGRTRAYWRARRAYKRAANALEERLAAAQTSETLLQLGKLELEVEEHERAEKRLLEALEREPGSGEVREKLGVLATRRGDFHAAIDHFDAALRRRPDDLTLRSNLAEACRSANLFERAEAEYMKVLQVTASHVQTHVGLGELYSEMAEVEEDGDLYDEAIGHFTRAIRLGERRRDGGFAGAERRKPPPGSKWLSRSELASIFYSRGHARIKLYDLEKARRSDILLREAKADFNRCLRYNPDQRWAKRTVERIERRLGGFPSQGWLEAKLAPCLVALLALATFVLAQGAFHFGWPDTSIPVGYYVLLTFGALVFLVAGLYLPRILKLRVGAIELEKSTVEEIQITGPVGIKAPRGLHQDVGGARGA